MRKTVIIISVLVAVAVVGTAMVYGGRGEGRDRGGRFMGQLTEEQRDAIHQIVTEMREAGATRGEIHAAVREMVKGWGIELPEPRSEGRGHGPRFVEQLTEEQRDAIHQMVMEMRETGASREEIHAAVREMLEGWGIEVPEHPHRGRMREIMGRLTEDQRDAIHKMVMEMREAGASREEIRAAVREMLEGWGIELPDECSGQGAQSQSLISPAEGEPATWGEIKKDFK
jgi:DNA-binding transcriptional regulator YhcF (GntR family)